MSKGPIAAAIDGTHDYGPEDGDPRWDDWRAYDRELVGEEPETRLFRRIRPAPEVVESAYDEEYDRLCGHMTD